MGKDSALGQDPLRWMKATQEKKLSSPEGAESADKKPIKSDQPAGLQSRLKQQTSPSMANDKPQDISKAAQSPGKVNNVMANASPSKPRVVVGRLYERPSAEKGQPAQRNEGISQEVKRHFELPHPASGTTKPVKSTVSEINHIPISTSTYRFSLYIIIAYTALMLILGYFVYSDLSKRMSRIESKIFAIEKYLHSKQ